MNNFLLRTPKLVLLLLVTASATHCRYECNVESLDNSTTSCDFVSQSLVQCKASATPGQPLLDRLKCCANIGFDELPRQCNDNSSYTLRIEQQLNPYKCEVKFQGVSENPLSSCCDVYLMAGLLYNLTLLGCSGEILSSDIRNFSDADQELSPVIMEDISVENVASDSVSLSWKVSSCRTKSILEISNDDNDEQQSFVAKCNMIDEYLTNCDRPSLNLTAAHLAPNTNYTVTLRQRNEKSPFCSKPTQVTFVTKEEPPLTGPEVFPGAIISPDDGSSPPCFEKDSDSPFNVTLLWKPLLDNAVARGRVVRYSISVNNFADLADSELTQNIETIANNVTFTVWCNRPFATVYIWAHNQAGRSIQSSNFTVQLDRTLERRRRFRLHHSSQSSVTINQLPSSTENVTFYFINSNNDLAASSANYVANKTVPFSLNLSLPLQLLGASADSIIGDEFLSTGIVKVLATTHTEETVSSFYPAIVIITASVAVSVLLIVTICYHLRNNKSNNKRHGSRRLSSKQEVPNPVPELPNCPNQYVLNQERNLKHIGKRTSVSGTATSSYDSSSSYTPITTSNLETSYSLLPSSPEYNTTSQEEDEDDVPMLSMPSGGYQKIPAVIPCNYTPLYSSSSSSSSSSDSSDSSLLT